MIKSTIHKTFRLFGLDIIEFLPREQTPAPDFRKELEVGSGYLREKINFIRSRVEEIIPASAPAAILLLRLETDWYLSTKYELVHVWSRQSEA